MPLLFRHYYAADATLIIFFAITLFSPPPDAACFQLRCRFSLTLLLFSLMPLCRRHL